MLLNDIKFIYYAYFFFNLHYIVLCDLDNIISLIWTIHEIVQKKKCYTRRDCNHWFLAVTSHCEHVNVVCRCVTWDSSFMSAINSAIFILSFVFLNIFYTQPIKKSCQFEFWNVEDVTHLEEFLIFSTYFIIVGVIRVRWYHINFHVT